MTLFNELGLAPQLLSAVEQQGYSHPTAIQEAAIPIILRNADLFATAPTGTGKTAAFAMPIIQKIIENPQKEIHSLILAPTRELAHQIADNFTAYASDTHLKITLIYGGVPQFRQVDKLKRGTHVVIATPGRLLDLINQGHVKLHKVQTFVLDECDRMLDMGFIDDIRKIGKYLENQTKQTLLFSATASPEIRFLAQELLNNPEKVDILPTESQKPKIKQWLFAVGQKNKEELLLQLLEDQQIDSMLVFTKTKIGADRLVETLRDNEHSAVAIHGDKSQRERSRNLDIFKSGRARLLVATDVAARGVDISALNYVVNFDMPEDAETYTHRIGRTGRAGTEGLAMSFCSAGEKKLLDQVTKVFGNDTLLEMEHDFRIELPEGRVGGGKSRSSSRGNSRNFDRRDSKDRRDRFGRPERNRNDHKDPSARAASESNRSSDANRAPSEGRQFGTRDNSSYRGQSSSRNSSSSGNGRGFGRSNDSGRSNSGSDSQGRGGRGFGASSSQRSSERGGSNSGGYSQGSSRSGEFRGRSNDSRGNSGESRGRSSESRGNSNDFRGKSSDSRGASKSFGGPKSSSAYGDQKPRNKRVRDF
jgi:ATP-dependent RNA helicase RhlE